MEKDETSIIDKMGRTFLTAGAPVGCCSVQHFGYVPMFQRNSASIFKVSVDRLNMVAGVGHHRLTGRAPSE
jgi:hypothetical protein